VSLRPHSKVTRAASDSFLVELASVQSSNVAQLKTSSSFLELYKATLAADCLLEALSADGARDLTAARLSARAVLTLVCGGQYRGATVEIRRMIEAVVHSVYFQDHPVEYEKYQRNPRQGFVTDKTTPILYCAFREFSFYGNYAAERLKEEPSGLAAQALEALTTDYGNASAYVHASLAVPTGVFPELLETTERETSKLAKAARRAFASGVIVVSAARREAFDHLPPMTRGWFDWVIGERASKTLKSGPFGLAPLT
jgi:hypothetical protein